MRRKDREITDNKQMEDIIRRAKIVHLGMCDNGCPYVVPLHYGYTFQEGQLVLYLHGAKEGKKSEILRKNPVVFAELETDVTLICGNEIPCEYGSSYASVMGQGTASFVTDISEKIYGLKLLMENQTGKTFHIDEKMAECTAVFRIDIPAVTAKRRSMPESL